MHGPASNKPHTIQPDFSPSQKGKTPRFFGNHFRCLSDFGWFSGTGIKKSLLTLIAFLLFLGISSRIVFAAVFSVPPTCVETYKSIEDTVFLGKSQTLTYDACNNHNLEYGRAIFYTYLDPLPCKGSCQAGACLACGEPWYPGPDTLFPINRDFTISSGKLMLSGDIGADRFYVGTGGMSFDEKGEYPVGSLEGISIGTLGTAIKEGKVDFTYILSTRKHSCNDECQTAWEYKKDHLWSAENCTDCWLSDERPMFKLNGSFSVGKNPRKDIDLFNILFDPSTSKSGSCSFIPIYYDADFEPFARTIDYGAWNSSCGSCEPNMFTSRDGYIRQDTITHRVRVPAWEKNVWIQDSFDGPALPSYMSNEGWWADVQNKRVSLNLGDFGILYFCCGTPSDNSAQPKSHLLSSVVLCQQGESLEQGDTQWRFSYSADGSGNKHLAYIYNGSDPNYPQQSPKYYQLLWNSNYTTVQQRYFNTAISTNNPLRVWNVSFDAQGRVIESTNGSGCSSGCGGSQAGYSKVEYSDFQGYDDLIKKQYNADGDVVVNNDYRVFRYGKNWPEYPITVLNAGFEVPNVAYGTYENVSPKSWKQTNDPNVNIVRVYKPNQTQWSSRYASSQSIPDRNQVVTLLGGAIRQSLDDIGVVRDTTYFLNVDTGAYIDPNTSQATITLIAHNPKDPNRLTDQILAEIDVNENSQRNGFGVQLEDGKWVTQSAFWDSSESPEMSGWQFELAIEGNYVDVDKVAMSALTFIGNETKPLLVSQIADPVSPSEPNMLFVTWDYNSSNYTAVERRWIDNQTARVIKYQYEDDSFNKVIAKTEYENLNENPDNPTGFSCTTNYTSTTVNTESGKIIIKETLYPSGKRKDVERLSAGQVVESYTENVKSGRKVNLQSSTYSAGHILTHTDARGGVTGYQYGDGYLLTQQNEPQTAAGQRITYYSYDGARRMKYEEHQDSEGKWIRTGYHYNETTGYLDSVVVDDDIPYGFNSYIGKKITTRYKYNDFGQVIRETSPDGVVTGKSYGLGGELKSDFVVAPGCDPNQADVNLTLVSQTWYMYDPDGRAEFIKKVKSEDVFQYGNPENTGDSHVWITTHYEYDFLGRKTAVIEDEGGLALRTEYQYNNQGETTKVILPNGKWTETDRNGRGQVIRQVIGHDGLDPEKWQVTEFEYDADGNLYKQTDPTGLSTIYQYDTFGRLEKVRRGASS